MNPALTPEQASTLVTALGTFIVAGSLCYLVRLLMNLNDQFHDMRQRMAVHFSEDENMGLRIQRIEENLDRIVKVRMIKTRKDDD